MVIFPSAADDLELLVMRDCLAEWLMKGELMERFEIKIGMRQGRLLL